MFDPLRHFNNSVRNTLFAPSALYTNLQETTCQSYRTRCFAKSFTPIRILTPIKLLKQKNNNNTNKMEKRTVVKIIIDIIIGTLSVVFLFGVCFFGW